MKRPGLSVEFFGVRGSYPAVGPEFSHFGGNTSALSVRCGTRRILLDGGLGLIPLGQRVATEGTQHDIFLNHLHYDHLTGLPFFAPLFMKGHRVRVFVPATMAEALKTFWGPPYFPLRVTDLPAAVEILPTPEGDTDLGSLLGIPGATLRTRFLGADFHPQDGVMLHSIRFAGREVVFATDIELPTQEAVDSVADFCRGTDLLICDTQYADLEYLQVQGFGHNSIEMTARLAEAAGIENLILFHHAPGRDDAALFAFEERARQRFPGSRAAFEGLVVDL